MWQVPPVNRREVDQFCNTCTLVNLLAQALMFDVNHTEHVFRKIGACYQFRESFPSQFNIYVNIYALYHELFYEVNLNWIFIKIQKQKM